jgi:hypothetical protein
MSQVMAATHMLLVFLFSKQYLLAGIRGVAVKKNTGVRELWTQVYSVMYPCFLLGTNPMYCKSYTKSISVHPHFIHLRHYSRPLCQPLEISRAPGSLSTCSYYCCSGHWPADWLFWHPHPT